MKFRFALVLLSAISATAGLAGPDQIFATYEHARQALLNGSVPEVHKAAREIAAVAEKATQPGISQKALVLAKTNDLSAARIAFAALSDEVIAYRETRCCERPALAYCSMEKKSWLQPAGEMSNPYVDASMRKCGEIKSPAKELKSHGGGHGH